MFESVPLLVLLLVGFLLVWFSTYLKLELGDVSKGVILLLPVFFHLLAAGKLTEFEGLGFKAKLNEVKRESVVKAARAADLMIRSARTGVPNYVTEARFQGGVCRQYILIADDTGKGNDGTLDDEKLIAVAVGIQASSLCGKLLAVVVVDAENKPIGYFTPEFFAPIVRLPLVAYNAPALPFEEAASKLRSSELGVILSNPLVRAKSKDAHHLILNADAKLGETYRDLAEKQVGVAVITDRLGRFDGLITRSAIEARVIGNLIAEK